MGSCTSSLNGCEPEPHDGTATCAPGQPGGAWAAEGAQHPAGAPAPLRPRALRRPVATEFLSVEDEDIQQALSQAAKRAPAAAPARAERKPRARDAAACDALSLSSGWSSSPRCSLAAAPRAAPPPPTCEPKGRPSWRADGAGARAPAPCAPCAAAPLLLQTQPTWSTNCSSWLMAADYDDPEMPQQLTETYLELALAGARGSASGGGASDAGSDDDISKALASLQQEHALPAAGSLAGGASALGARVLKGVYRNAPAAIKIMPTHGNEGLSVQHAVEMAVLSSVQHPNIVQAYACLPDVAWLGGDGPDGTGLLRFRSLLPDETPSQGCACDVLITELCDGGTLKDALSSGALPPTHHAGADLLIDVAAALLFMHSMCLAHGGVRSDNVFLRTDPLRPWGLQAKLGGFGRARILSPDGRDAAAAAAAAVAAAPGARASTGSDGASCRSERGARAAIADDVFAFGALVSEVVSACHPGCAAGATPGPAAAAACAWCRAFGDLAAACMSPDPAARPSMADAIARLEAAAARPPGGAAEARLVFG